MRTGKLNRIGASVVELIITVTLLIIFAVVIIIIISHGFLSSLVPSNFNLFPTSTTGPSLCTFNYSAISTSQCDYKVTSQGGSSGLIYSLYINGKYNCSYIAGKTTCSVNVLKSSFLVCNTSGKEPGGGTSSLGSGGTNSLNLSCS